MSFKLNANIKIALYFAAFVVVWMLSGLFIGGKEEEEKVVPPTPTVVVTPSTAQGYARVLELVGRTEAEQLVKLSTQVEGEITRLPLEKGMKVQMGDVLAEIDVATRREEMKAAKARVKAAAALAKAARNLSSQGFQAQTTKTTREADLAEAQRQLAQAQFNLENTQIVSPIDGVVEALPMEEGDYAGVGNHVATVLRTDEFLITCFVPQKERLHVHQGKKVQATLASGEEVEGVIRFISQNADDLTQTYQLEAVVDGTKHPTLTAGMTAQIKIPLETVPAHFIPHSALVLDAEGNIGVMVNENQTAKFKKATLLEDTRAGIWLGDLPNTLEIITRGQAAVKDGAAIKPKREEAE